MHSNYQDGMQTDLFGQEAVPVNRFRAPEKDSEKKTKDTSGLSSSASSRSYDLQWSLENRLRQRMDVNGSPEYEMTWKRWDMQSGPPICRLAVSQRRTKEIGCSGWQTPQRHDAKGTWRARYQKIAEGEKHQNALQDQVQTVGWPTVSSRDWKDTPGMSTEGINPDGSKRTRLDQLPRVAALTGWPTPNHNTTGPGNQGREGGENLQTAVSGLIPSQSPAPTENGEGCLAGWPSPDGGVFNTSEQWESWMKRKNKSDSIGGMPLAISAKMRVTNQPKPAVSKSVALALPPKALWLEAQWRKA